MNRRPGMQPPFISDSVRYLANAVLIVVLIGLVLALGFGVGYWMMSAWDDS